jgi:uncharacterized protein
LAKGIEIRAAHFPGRAPVDAYGNGGFRFADMSHIGSILCLPSGIHGWSPKDSGALALEDIERILSEAGEIEVILFGMGNELRPIPKPLKEALRAKNISSDPMSTGAAVRTYNVLLAEERRAAAALIAVE